MFSQVKAIHSVIIGTAGLVFYVFPYLGILFAPLAVFYFSAALYYRRTSVETKRLDSLMRSALYASYSGRFGHLSSWLLLTLYSETLTGLSTVRGYGEQVRSVNTCFLDLC